MNVETSLSLTVGNANRVLAALTESHFCWVILGGMFLNEHSCAGGIICLNYLARLRVKRVVTLKNIMNATSCILDHKSTIDLSAAGMMETRTRDQVSCAPFNTSKRVYLNRVSYDLIQVHWASWCSVINMRKKMRKHFVLQSNYSSCKEWLNFSGCVCCCCVSHSHGKQSNRMMTRYKGATRTFLSCALGALINWRPCFL